MFVSELHRHALHAVTKSGTNEWHGGAMYNYRNDANMASAGFRATPVMSASTAFQSAADSQRQAPHLPRARVAASHIAR